MRAVFTRAFRLFGPISPCRARSCWHAVNSSTTLCDNASKPRRLAELHDRLAALAVTTDRVARQAHSFNHAEHGISQPGHHRPHRTVPFHPANPPDRTNTAAATR